MFSKEELERYKRHLVLKQVGGPGQQKLKKAKVLIIGAGGLGSPVSIYLAAAGVGTMGLVDDDKVSLSNLQRQIVHNTDNISAPKVESAAQTLEAVNPHVNVNQHNLRLTASNIMEIISQYDIIVDGSDNFKTRYLVNDACYFARKTLVFAALGPFDGQLTTIKSYEKNEQGSPNPNYRCLFPDPPEPGTVANCSEVGILGAVAGIVGTLQATEVLKEIIGVGENLVGKLLIYDALSARMQTLKYKWSPDNPLNGELPIFRDLSHHQH